MDLEEIGFRARNWVLSAQGRDYWRDLVLFNVKKLVEIYTEVIL